MGSTPLDVVLFGSDLEVELLLLRALVSIFSSWSSPAEECTTADAGSCIAAAK
jgi:hypothetical protein